MDKTGDQLRDTLLELKIISYLIRKDYRPCDEITRDLFSIKAYRLFFDIVNTHRTTYPRDVLVDTVAERVKKSDLVNPYIIKVFKCRIDNISRKNMTTMIFKMKKLYFLRFAYEQAEEIITNIESSDIDGVKRTARKIYSMGSMKKRTYTGDYLKDYEKRKAIIKTRMEKSKVGVPTGVAKFDKCSGGLMKGELGILVGESGMGKSLGLENFALYAWEADYNVAYFTIEMTKDQVGFRADARLMRLKYNKFRLGSFTDKELLKWEKGIQQYRKTKDNFFEIVALPRSCSAVDIETELERIQDQYGSKVDLSVVDYLNIMRPNNYSISGKGNPKDWTAQVEIAWNLKEIATDFQEEGMSVWTGNQVTDEGEGVSILRKRHVKYGRGIVEAANLVVGLVQDSDDEFENIMRFQTIKLRDLKSIPTITLRPNFDMMCLNDEYRRESSTSLKKSSTAKKRKVKVK